MTDQRAIARDVPTDARWRPGSAGAAQILVPERADLTAGFPFRQFPFCPARPHSPASPFRALGVLIRDAAFGAFADADHDGRRRGQTEAQGRQSPAR